MEDKIDKEFMKGIAIRILKLLTERTDLLGTLSERKCLNIEGEKLVQDMFDRQYEEVKKMTEDITKIKGEKPDNSMHKRR